MSIFIFIAHTETANTHGLGDFLIENYGRYVQIQRKQTFFSSFVVDERRRFVEELALLLVDKPERRSREPLATINQLSFRSSVFNRSLKIKQIRIKSSCSIAVKLTNVDQ